MLTKNPLYYINIEKNILNKFYWFFVNKKHNSIKFILHDTFYVNINEIFLYIIKVRIQGNKLILLKSQF